MQRPIWPIPWVRLSLLALLLVGMLIPPSVGAAQESGPVMVLLKAPPAALAELKAQHGVGFDYGADGFAVQVSPAALRGLQQRPDVFVEVQPDRQIQGRFERLSGKSAKPGSGGSSVAPADRTPWGIEVTYNSTSVTSTSGGTNIKIAVLDTGMVSHRDLPAPLRCVDASGVAVRGGRCADGHGHGTHVTGTILATGGGTSGIYGVAPSASYGAWKVCGNGGFCNAAGIAWSIRDAADWGAHIISMSLGGSALSTAERDAIDYATGKGVLIIAAAGNSGSADDTINYPAAYYKVVAVASLTLEGESLEANTARTITADKLAVNSWSSRGKTGCDTSKVGQAEWERCIEVAAPGHQVESTYKDGAYAVMSGTSMATPHLAGLAAKLWQGSAASTRDWLRSSTLDVTRGYFTTAGGSEPSSVGSGYEQHSGFGNRRVS